MSATIKQAAPAATPATLSRVLSRLDMLTDRLLFGIMLLALFATPFEVGYPPLGRIFFATFTNLEVVLLALIGAMGLRLVVSSHARGRLLRLPLLLPMIALLLACAVSTEFAEFRSLGWQFTYRLAMGMLVFAAVNEALRGRRRLLAALCTFATAAVIAACIGLLEFVPWFDIEPWLKMFKPQPTTVGGLLRLSGSFEYANGAAVYFEMALPVLMGLALMFSSSRLVGALFGAGGMSSRRQWVVRCALYLGTGLLTMALILTFSRASWMGVVVALAVFGGAGFLLGRGPRFGGVWKAVRLPLLVTVLVIGGAALYIYMAQPLLRLRLTGENDRAWYNYDLRQMADTGEIAANDVVTVPLMLTNQGPMQWNADRVPVVHISYHWWQEGSAYYAVFEGLRTSLPRDVAPGESIRLDAVVQAPPKAGKYTLNWDLVQEDVAWFYEKSKGRIESRVVEVGPPTGAAVTVPATNRPPVAVQQIEDADTSTVARTELWRVAWAMFRSNPLVGVGPDGFRNLYGKYSGKAHWNANIYTNNTYIEMFTDLGLLGGLAFLWLIGLGLWRSLRNVLLKQWSEPPPGAVAIWLVCLGAGAALLSFAVHGLVDYFLFSTPLYTTFWFVLAVSVLWPRLVSAQANKSAVQG